MKLWGRSLDDCYSPLILLLIVGGELLALILTGKGTQEGYDRCYLGIVERRIALVGGV